MYTPHPVSYTHLPYNGLGDLQNRLLRHVSPAFGEDPLRVLRVARFAARYAHLGFRIADETLALMREMTHAGELEHLTPERVWKETESALTTRNPQAVSYTHLDVYKRQGQRLRSG